MSVLPEPESKQRETEQILLVGLNQIPTEYFHGDSKFLCHRSYISAEMFN